MNTRELLIEATYNLGHVIDLIYNDIIQPAIIKMKTGKIEATTKNITEYLENSASKYTNEAFNLYLSLRKSSKHQSQWFLNPKEGEQEKNYVIYLNTSKKDVATVGMEENKRYFKEILNHELTHFMDTLRANHKMLTTEPVVTSYKYYNDTGEFNSFFHEIKDSIKKDKKRWNKIKSMEDLRDSILNKIPHLEHLLQANPQGYKNIEKKFLKRLARENLLPVGMIKSF